MVVGMVLVTRTILVKGETSVVVMALVKSNVGLDVMVVEVVMTNLEIIETTSEVVEVTMILVITNTNLQSLNQQKQQTIKVEGLDLT